MKRAVCLFCYVAAIACGPSIPLPGPSDAARAGDTDGVVGAADVDDARSTADASPIDAPPPIDGGFDAALDATPPIDISPVDAVDAPRPSRMCTTYRDCVDLVQVCDSARGVCVDCVADGDCAATDYCATGGSCRPRVCAAGAAECLDASRVRVCDSHGGGWVESPCEAGSTCAAGVCMGRLCAPGARDCADAATRRECAADGLSRSTTPCASTELCSGGACVSRACTPGEATCADGLTRRVCNADGLSYSVSACPAGQGCSGGACRAFVCTPGSASCTDLRTRQACNPDGQATTTAACPAMQSCSAGSCVAWLCSPGSSTCRGAARSVCNPDGLTSVDVPCTSGQVCEGGACVAPFCAAGTYFCDAAGVRQLCAADGRSAAPAPCAAGVACNRGVCGSQAETCPGVDVPLDTDGVTIDLTTLRGGSDIGTSCGSHGPSAGWTDWVAHFRLDATRDVSITARAQSTTVLGRFNLHVGSCSGAAPLVGSCFFSSSTAKTYRSLPPGDYYIVGETQPGPTTAQIAVRTSNPGLRPMGDSCANAAEVVPNGAAVGVPASTYSGATDVGTSCGSGGSNQASWEDGIWHFRLDSTQDVRVDFTGLSNTARAQVYRGCGGASPAVGACLTLGRAPSSYRIRGAAAGDYYVVVEGAGSIANSTTVDPTVAVVATAPGARAIGDACSSAAEVEVDGVASGIISTGYDQQADVGVACTATTNHVGFIDAIWHFRLGTNRNTRVQITGAPTGTTWQIQRGCAADSPIVPNCQNYLAGAYNAWTNLPAGDYYLIAEWPAPAAGTNAIYVQVTTEAPIPSTLGDTCATAIPLTFGTPASVDLGPIAFLPDHENRCGATRANTGVSSDVVFSYTLTAPSDVILTTTQSAGYTAFLDVTTRCGDPSSGVGVCTATTGTGGRHVLRNQTPGTYFINMQTPVLSGTFAITAQTAPSGTTAGYGVTRLVTSPTVGLCDQNYLASADNASSLTALPFDFPFWGVTLPAVTPVNLSSNGFVNFDGVSSSASSGTLPSMSAPNGVVAPLWRNLVLGTEGVCLGVTGLAPRRVWEVSWLGARLSGAASANVNVTALFYETTGVIDFVYGTTATSGVVGLESPTGLEGHTWTAASQLSNLALRFTPAQ